jgi:starvation-inducible outer membrane lipoprotein
MGARILMVAATTLGLSACMTMPARLAQVQVHKDSSPLLADCQRVGPIMTDTRGGPFDFMEVAEAAAREEALRLGGDSLAILNVQRLPLGRIVLQGIAYKCY